MDSFSILCLFFFFKRYTGKSRSKSRTPPHWRLAAEERKRFVELNESRKQSSIEQTNSSENTDMLTLSTEQMHNREITKRNRSYLKNGDTNDENETSTNNAEDQSVRDLTKRSRRHEKRRENVDDDKEERIQQPQPAIQSSIVRAEPKEREHRHSSPLIRQRREHRTETKHHRSTMNKHDENEPIHDKCI